MGPSRCVEVGCIRPAWPGSAGARCWWCDADRQDRKHGPQDSLDCASSSKAPLGPVTGDEKP